MKNQFIPFDKLSKKKKKEENRKHRILIGFNTGSRPMRSVKNPTRAMLKNSFRKNENKY